MLASGRRAGSHTQSWPPLLCGAASQRRLDDYRAAHSARAPGRLLVALAAAARPRTSILTPLPDVDARHYRVVELPGGPRAQQHQRTSAVKSPSLKVFSMLFPAVYAVSFYYDLALFRYFPEA